MPSFAIQKNLLSSLLLNLFYKINSYKALASIPKTLKKPQKVIILLTNAFYCAYLIA